MRDARRGPGPRLCQEPAPPVRGGRSVEDRRVVGPRAHQPPAGLHPAGHQAGHREGCPQPGHPAAHGGERCEDDRPRPVHHHRGSDHAGPDLPRLRPRPAPQLLAAGRRRGAGRRRRARPGRGRLRTDPPTVPRLRLGRRIRRRGAAVQRHRPRPQRHGQAQPGRGHHRSVRRRRLPGSFTGQRHRDDLSADRGALPPRSGGRGRPRGPVPDRQPGPGPRSHRPRDHGGHGRGSVHRAAHTATGRRDHHDHHHGSR